MEISRIPSSIRDEDLENTVISICKDFGVEIDPKNIESCHRLPFSRNSRVQDKRMIVKFVFQVLVFIFYIAVWLRLQDGYRVIKSWLKSG